MREEQADRFKTQPGRNGMNKHLTVVSSSSAVTHGCLYWSSVLVTLARKVKGESSAGVFGVHVSFSDTVKVDSLRRANQRLDAGIIITLLWSVLSAHTSYGLMRASKVLSLF